MMLFRTIALGIALSPAFLTACQKSLTPDEELTKIIGEQGLKGAPTTEDPIPSPDEPLAQLGRSLFFSKTLSGNGDVACVSCHHPLLGGGDDLSLPIGIDAEVPELLGPGRKLNHGKVAQHTPSHTGPVNVPRNSPTTFAVAYYKESLFWDGRVRLNQVETAEEGYDQGIVTPDSLFSTVDPQASNDLVFAQSRFPVTSPDEMLGFSDAYAHNEDIRENLEARLRMADESGVSPWLRDFRTAFNAPEASSAELMTFANVSKALAAYQRSQDFINTPWKRYVEGDKSALSEAQKQGAILFFAGQSGADSCASCHSGDFFTDEKFHNLAVPQIGPGKDKLDNDYGRKRVTRLAEDKYRFRTPHLLNVAATAPYGHSGAYATLAEILQHHVDPAQAVENYDFSLQQLAQFEGINADQDYPKRKENSQYALRLAQKQGDLPKLHYTPAELGKIEAFLGALTDPCVEDAACLKPWLPDGSEKAGMQLLDTKLQSDTSIAQTLFTEVAAQAGIEHQFRPRRVPLPETATVDDPTIPKLIISNLQLTMTGGVAVSDINQDGLPDIFLPGGSDGEDKLYLNLGAGQFKDITAQSGLNMQGFMTNGATFADVTGDGLDDLFVGGVVVRLDSKIEGGEQLPSRFFLWKNLGNGKFSNITESSGLSFERNIFSSSFGDYDLDGDLDMAVGHWHRTLKNDKEEVHLWENTGNGKFVAANKKVGLAGAWSAGIDWSFTPTFADVNNDGWPDLVYTNDFEQTQYYLNREGKRFENATNAEVITDENGMGAAIGDYDNDGDLDWFVSAVYDPDPKKLAMKASNWGTTGNRLYRNKGDGTFEDVTDAAGVRDGGWGWAACMADFNLDGSQDIFHVNGYLYDDHPAWLYYAEKFSRDRPRMYMNDGKGNFTDVAEEWGFLPGEGRAISCTDFDRDGDVDILIQQLARPTRLYLNRAADSSPQQFVGVRLKGGAGNPAMAGARVKLTTNNGLTLTREIQVGSNYLSQNAAEAHFGLPVGTVSVSLEVTAMAGKVSKKLENVQPGQWLEIDL